MTIPMVDLHVLNYRYGELNRWSVHLGNFKYFMDNRPKLVLYVSLVKHLSADYFIQCLELFYFYFGCLYFVYYLLNIIMFKYYLYSNMYYISIIMLLFHNLSYN